MGRSVSDQEVLIQAIRDVPFHLYPCDVKISSKADTSRLRNYAYTEDLGEKTLVVISPRAAGLPEEKISAILWHELGHVLDFEYSWPEIWEKDPEIRADRIIRKVYGVVISYDPTDWVQTLGDGVPRPRWLR